MPQAPAVDYDALAAQHGGAPAAVDYDALAQQHGAAVPAFTQSDTTPNEVDPNTVGTFIRHIWSGINPVQLGQLLPFPKSLGGSGTDHPLLPSNVLKAAQAVKAEGDAAWNKGDKVTAAAKYVESIVPILGPMMSHMGNQLQAGKYAAVAGDTAALAAQTAAGPALKADLNATYPLANRASVLTNPQLTQPTPQAQALQFAQARGVPLDAATVSDNIAVKRAQAAADQSFLGSGVAAKAKAAQSAAMERVGGELADETLGTTTTPEQAGTSLRNALAAKVEAHHQAANIAYDSVRGLESPETAVDLTPVKTALRPVYKQMTRQMPITQQQANPGLKALDNIITGPDTGPLSQVDRDLSAMKSVAREQGGLAKLAVAKLDTAVTTAAKNGGPDVWAALQEGRQATAAKYAASEVLDTLADEPVKAIRAITAPKDAGIQQLRTVAAQVPQQVPEIARGYLEDLLDRPQRVADWNKLGTETKAILFPKAGQTEALDNFFRLSDRISKTNINPSGSGHQAYVVGQMAMLGYDPLKAVAGQVTAAALAKLLRSPAAISALTRGLSVPGNAAMAVRAAAALNLVRAARSAGVALDLPAAAQQQATPERPQ